MGVLSLHLKIKVRHDYDSGAERVAAFGPRLAEGWRDGAADATRLMGQSVEDTISGRTSMSAAVARAITEVSFVETPGGRSVARGTVGFTKPPERFYPRTAKALSFVIGGRRITVASVRGSRPHKLVGRGANLSAPGVEQAFEDAVKDVRI